MVWQMMNRLTSKSALSIFPRQCSITRYGRLNYSQLLVGKVHRSPPTPIVSFIFVRTLKKGLATDDPFSESAGRALQRLQMKDRVPRRYEMIYRAELGRYFVATQTAIVVLTFMFAIVTLKVILLGDFDVEEKEQGELHFLFSKKKFREDIAVLRDNLGIEPDDMVDMSINDVRKQHPDFWKFMILASFVMTLPLFVLLRMTPVRLYCAPSGHCLATYYGILYPGRIFLRELVAGTVKQVERPLLGLPTYKDATGRRMFLSHSSFRSAEDYHGLLSKDMAVR